MTRAPESALSVAWRVRLRQTGRVKIAVMVDVDGTADLGTLRVTGDASGSARPIIESWLAGSHFMPAKQGGVAVGGLYTIEPRSRVMRG